MDWMVDGLTFALGENQQESLQTISRIFRQVCWQELGELTEMWVLSPPPFVSPSQAENLELLHLERLAPLSWSDLPDGGRAGLGIEE